MWFKKNGLIKAKVTQNGALILEHDREADLPLQVWHDLRTAFLVFYKVEDDAPIELQGTRQMLHSWLRGGKQAETLACEQTDGLRVPLGATAVAIAVSDGHFTEVICVANLKYAF